MSYEQADLFTPQARNSKELPRPNFGPDEANLHFRRRQEEVTFRGLGMFDDEDERNREPTYRTVVSASLPDRSGIFVTEKIGNIERKVPFTIHGLEEHTDVGELVNWWLEQKHFTPGVLATKLNKETEAGQWILKNASELNQARRYWRAVQCEQAMAAIDEQIEQLKRSRNHKVFELAVAVEEFKIERNFTQEERAVLKAEHSA